ncbi:MAG: hypothetical protein MJ200_05835 [Mycoplasmoidaceae bacterium]|nr:hypothetical protein [Mycoplasmoidaceae bacterium]
MHTEKVLQDVAMGLTATFDSIIIATSLMPVKTQGQRTINIAYIITSGIDLVVQIASYSLFRHFK